MFKKSGMVVSVVSLMVVAGLLVGCAAPKKQSTLDEAKPKADTAFKDTKPMVVDTTDEVSYNDAALDAETLRLMQEKMLPVYFGYNKYDLSTESSNNLATAAAFLKEKSRLRVLIEGHCDERGSAEYNMGLGDNRARVVKEYLLNLGVSAAQLEITSFGKERPAVPGCNDDACHSKNRRAEFKAIGK